MQSTASQGIFFVLSALCDDLFDLFAQLLNIYWVRGDVIRYMHKALQVRVYCDQVHDEQYAFKVSGVVLVFGAMCDIPANLSN